MVRIYKRYIYWTVIKFYHILFFFLGLDARLCYTHTHYPVVVTYVLIVQNYCWYIYDSNTTLVYTRKIYVIRVLFCVLPITTWNGFSNKLQPVGGHTGTSKIQSQHHHNSCLLLLSSVSYVWISVKIIQLILTKKYEDSLPRPPPHPHVVLKQSFL